MTVSIESSVQRLRNRLDFQLERFSVPQNVQSDTAANPASYSVSGRPLSLGMEWSERANCPC